MDSERQVLEGLVEKARMRHSVASEEHKKWLREARAAQAAEQAYQSALEVYLEEIGGTSDDTTNGSFSQSTPIQKKLQMDIDVSNDARKSETEESEQNDEEKFGKSFVLRNTLYENRAIALKVDDILNALPDYSTMDKEFLQKMLPKFVRRKEVTRDENGFYHAGENLSKPERRVGARAKIGK